MGSQGGPRRWKTLGSAFVLSSHFYRVLSIFVFTENIAVFAYRFAFILDVCAYIRQVLKPRNTS